jgi:hypothetical protein
MNYTFAIAVKNEIEHATVFFWFPAKGKVRITMKNVLVKERICEQFLQSLEREKIFNVTEKYQMQITGSAKNNSQPAHLLSF